MIQPSQSVFALAVSLGAMLSGAQAVAASYEIVAQLQSGGGTGGLSSPLTANEAGNLYGERDQSAEDAGEIFTLSAKSGYKRINVLYTYSIEAQQKGANPRGGVTLDHGQVIGTTAEGDPYLSGTVFNLGKLSAPTLTVLHDFNYEQTDPTDGAEPGSGLTAGLSHLFYGTTAHGGGGKSPGRGTVYFISGSTTAPLYRVIYRFGGSGDGINPTNGRLAVDSQGRLYGETFLGGANGSGTVFMMQKTDVGWQEQVIYSFPFSGSTYFGQTYENVVLDQAGNLYGCAAGGTHNQGEVFRLAAPTGSGGAWQQSVLYSFGDQPDDPITTLDSEGCGITIDPASLFIVGTSAAGGDNKAGTIWQLKPPAAGQNRWHEAVDHSFFGRLPDDGGTPYAAPLRVGNTYYGSNSMSAAIYAFTPDF